jgi:hypothetical protein
MHSSEPLRRVAYVPFWNGTSHHRDNVLACLQPQLTQVPASGERFELGRAVGAGEPQGTANSGVLAQSTVHYRVLADSELRLLSGRTIRRQTGNGLQGSRCVQPGVSFCRP